MSIPIAARRSSEAIDDGDNDDGGSNSDSIDRGKIVAVLEVLVAELEEKEKNKAEYSNSR